MPGNIKITDSAIANYAALQGITVPQLIQNVPQTDAGFFFFTHVATTSDIPIVFPAGVTTFGLAWFWNTDPTNYVDVGSDVAGAIAPLMRLYGAAPGTDASRSGVIPLTPGITLRTQAHTATVELQVFLFNR